MTASRVNLRELADITPADVATYLSAAGWREVGPWRRNVVWSIERGGREYEILAPDDAELRDYGERVSDLVGTLTEVENRGFSEILLDLRSLLVDVQYLRTEPRSPSGSIPLREGVKAVRGVHDLFLVAATTASLSSPMAVLPANNPSEAWRFLDHVRLGESKRGSYIMRVETPLGTTTDHLPLAPRVVLSGLYRAVSAARAAAIESLSADDVRPFGDVIEQGVSANLCEALVAIGGNAGSAFEFHFAWAPARPMDMRTPDLRFDRGLLSSLSEAGKHLRADVHSRMSTLSGRVIRLERAQPDGTGEVLITGLLTFDGVQTPRQKVSLTLSAEQYREAIRAHDNNLVVMVTGRLVEYRKGQHLEGIESFEILA